MGLVGDFLSDKFVPRDERVRLFRTWGSGLGMLPIGGTAAWGNATWAPDDTPEMVERSLTYGCAPAVTPFLVWRSAERLPCKRGSAQGMLLSSSTAAWGKTYRRVMHASRYRYATHIGVSLRWHQ